MPLASHLGPAPHPAAASRTCDVRLWLSAMQCGTTPTRWRPSQDRGEPDSPVVVYEFSSVCLCQPTDRSRPPSIATTSVTKNRSCARSRTQHDCRRRNATRSSARARQLVEGVRTAQVKRTGLDAFLRKYDLSSQEGVILMCLAEALLRIPDDATADKLIADKISAGDWAAHLERRRVAVRQCVDLGTDADRPHRAAERRGPARSARCRWRALPDASANRCCARAFRQAMRIMGHQFVMGRTIEEALERSASAETSAVPPFVRHAGRIGADDAPMPMRYLEAYHKAIADVRGARRAGRRRSRRRRASP